MMQIVVTSAQNVQSAFKHDQNGIVEAMSHHLPDSYGELYIIGSKRAT